MERSDLPEDIDESAILFLRDFFLSDRNDVYPVPLKGPDTIDVSYYLNHGDEANLDIVTVPGCPRTVFMTKRDVEKGEELTINYRQFPQAANANIDRFVHGESAFLVM